MIDLQSSTKRLEVKSDDFTDQVNGSEIQYRLTIAVHYTNYPGNQIEKDFIILITDYCEPKIDVSSI